MKGKEKLIRAIRRSEKAYELYKDGMCYFQALRILKANKKIYFLLEEFIFECEEKDLEKVFLYIYHLEDWFENFEHAQDKQPGLGDLFVFERFAQSPPFPKNFIEEVLKN